MQCRDQLCFWSCTVHHYCPLSPSSPTWTCTPTWFLSPTYLSTLREYALSHHSKDSACWKLLHAAVNCEALSWDAHLPRHTACSSHDLLWGTWCPASTLATLVYVSCVIGEPAKSLARAQKWHIIHYYICHRWTSAIYGHPREIMHHLGWTRRQFLSSSATFHVPRRWTRCSSSWRHCQEGPQMLWPFGVLCCCHHLW
jgi:hypothetical protein